MSERYYHEKELSVVGKWLPPIDGVERVTGKAPFTADIKLPEMLYAKVLRSPHAHAKIKKIDTSKAEALPGVRAVITYQNVPRNRGYGAGAASFFSAADNQYTPFDDRVRLVGDEVAAVAADTLDIAEEALDLIEVEYETLPAVFEAEEAMKLGAPQLHPDHPFGNIALGIKQVSKVGDPDKGFTEADKIFEDSYSVHDGAPTPLEPHACVAYWEGDKVTLWSCSQNCFQVQTYIAGTLKMPLNKVRAITTYSGGGFGNKYQERYLMITVLLAKKTGRPVKLVYTREEGIVNGRGGRYPMTFKLKAGVKNDGTITALTGEWITALGPYYILSGGPTFIFGTYKSPYKSEGYGVFTNRPVVHGYYRGVGAPQAYFAQEQLLDEVAEKLGMDPTEFKQKNYIDTGWPFPAGPLSTCGIKEAMKIGKEAIGWEMRHKPGAGPTYEGTKKRGIGFGGFVPWIGRGFAASAAVVKINRDGSVILLAGFSDTGGNQRTTMAQTAAEVVGVRYENVSVVCGDTDATPMDTGSFASRVGATMSFAVWKAATEAKLQLLGLAAPLLGVKPEELDTKEGQVFVKASPEKKLSFAEVFVKGTKPSYGTCIPELVGRGAVDIAFGTDPTRSFHGAFSEVEVDTETGEVKVLKHVLLPEVGRALNPFVVEAQAEGGGIQGIGWALAEHLIWDKTTGKMLNPNYEDYKIPTFLDMPDDIMAPIVEPIEPLHPLGVKGVGEPAITTTPPSIANAVYNAIGVRFKDAPLTPDKILRALGKL